MSYDRFLHGVFQAKKQNSSKCKIVVAVLQYRWSLVAGEELCCELCFQHRYMCRSVSCITFNLFHLQLCLVLLGDGLITHYLVSPVLCMSFWRSLLSGFRRGGVKNIGSKPPIFSVLGEGV